MSKRKTKANSTPEEWEAHLSYMREWRNRNLDEQRAKARNRANGPEAKARRAAYLSDPEVREKKLASHRKYSATPQAKARKRERYNTPEKIAEQQARLAARAVALPERQRSRAEYSRDYARMKNSGFTRDDYDRAMELQGGKCAVCGSTKRLHCDHDHATNKPRGMLCFSCNATEGRISASGLTTEEFCRRLHNYVTSPPLGIR